jgi:hypothetical protein
VKQPETIHTVSNAVLTAWLARKGRTPREMALKSRLQELLGLTTAVGLKRTTAESLKSYSVACGFWVNAM